MKLPIYIWGEQGFGMSSCCLKMNKEKLKIYWREMK